MKSHLLVSAWLSLALNPALHAQEKSPEIIGLEKAATDFVAAYNKKDAAAIAALFTADGEITDLSGEEVTSGREEIKAFYADIFDGDDAPSVAVEVASVRLVAPNLAIEDGTAHFTPPGEDAPPYSHTYTAVLTKSGDAGWQIASSRTLKDVTDAAGHLFDLANVLKGEWTSASTEGVRLDLAFGWDPSGKFLTGEMLTTTADAEPQAGTIRIGWNAAKKSIVSWMFDSKGGAIEGTWTATDNGWQIEAAGTTADGETFAANQELTTGGGETIIWNATQRVIDGEKQPDNTMRLVRQAPDSGEAN